MRLYILFGLCIFLALYASTEARRGKHAWRHKKQKHQSKLAKFGENVKDGGIKMKKHNSQDLDLLRPPVPGDDFYQKKLNLRRKNRISKKKRKNAHKKHEKNMAWLNIKPVVDCEMECKPGEVCISGPIDKRPMCVDKRDLKKSMKMFNRFHKKEIKSWRKFQKENYKKDIKWLMKQDKLEKKHNAKLIAKKEHYMKKHGLDHMKKEDTDELFKKHGEDAMKQYDLEEAKKKQQYEEALKKHGEDKETHDFQDSMTKLDFKDPLKEYDLKKEDFMEKEDIKEEETEVKVFQPPQNPKSHKVEECSPDEFVQMRTRMMGWFHLLHGQDHLARKARGGKIGKKIGKFYKHKSVKKELREHEGIKCGCLKSAMWEFHQLDKSLDDHLSPDELATLEENNLEPCMKPYLSTCDRNNDHKISSDEWCCCFSHVVAPCFRKVEEIKKALDKDAFIPRCDKEGYYMREQCKKDEHEQLLCWCSDISGNELKGTATNGRAHCSKMAMLKLENTPFF